MNIGDVALGGLRVVDLASLYAGPLIATTLGDFGADVVKVEHPDGDTARRWGKSRGDVPLWWKVISRNKQLIALDLHRESDRAIARELCLWADVVIENFRPGRMADWGLGYEELSAENAGLIYVSVTGFGETGPYSSRPGFGTLAEALSGFAALTGEADGAPTLPPFGLADGVAGFAGAYAVLIALYWRKGAGRGRGQAIDLSLYEPLFSILGPQTTEYQQLGVVQRRQGNRSPRTAPRNTYETSDGRWVALSAGTQSIANRIFMAIGRQDLIADPRFNNAVARREHSDEIDGIVEAWIIRHSLAEVLGTFESADAPIAPVYTVDQIVEDEHYLARETVITVPDDDLGSVQMQNVVPRLSVTPGLIRHPGATNIDRDREAVLEKLRLARDRVSHE
jgi:formyl-CoA transferase